MSAPKYVSCSLFLTVLKITPQFTIPRESGVATGPPNKNCDSCEVESRSPHKPRTSNTSQYRLPPLTEGSVTSPNEAYHLQKVYANNVWW